MHRLCLLLVACGIASFALHKLFALVGQGYGIAAAILLTPLVSESERLNSIVVGPVAEGFFFVTTGVSLGVMIASVLSSTGTTAPNLAAPAMLLCGINMVIYGPLVFDESAHANFDSRRRAKNFGGITLGVSLGLQLLAA